MDGKINKDDNRLGWNEETSRLFIDYGQYFVPRRDMQMQTIAGLLIHLQRFHNALELCCGEGRLADVLLERFPAINLQGMDGSNTMLGLARQRLAGFGERFRGELFDLAASNWRRPEPQFDAVVSSLAIHHLTGAQKQQLFNDLLQMLRPGGVFVIADIVELKGQAGKALAAETWDAVVRDRALELDGNTTAFDFFRNEGWNMFRYLNPDDIDKPSPLTDQLKWLEQAGFVDVEVHWLLAGHAIFSGNKVGSND